MVHVFLFFSDVTDTKVNTINIIDHYSIWYITCVNADLQLGWLYTSYYAWTILHYDWLLQQLLLSITMVYRMLLFDRDCQIRQELCFLYGLFVGGTG